MKNALNTFIFSQNIQKTKVLSEPNGIALMYIAAV